MSTYAVMQSCTHSHAITPITVYSHAVMQSCTYSHAMEAMHLYTVQSCSHVHAVMSTYTVIKAHNQNRDVSQVAVS